MVILGSFNTKGSAGLHRRHRLQPQLGKVAGLVLGWRGNGCRIFPAAETMPLLLPTGEGHGQRHGPDPYQHLFIRLCSLTNSSYQEKAKAIDQRLSSQTVMTVTLI